MIKSGQTESAKGSIDKLVADYSQDASLSEALYEIARNFGWSNKYEEEKNIYQQIIQKHPDSLTASKARLGYAKAEVQSLIVSGRFDEAKAALDKLVTDFSGQPDLADTLYWIARRYEWSDKYYEWSGKYEKVKNIFEQIVEKYPNSGKFDKARLGVYRMNICSLIVSKQLEAAQDEFNKMMIDFSEHPDLPDTLGLIGRRYESSEKYKEANDIYQQIIQNYPGSSYAEKAKFDIQRAQIRSLIVSQDYNDANLAAVTLAKAGAALDKLIADFNGNPDLPETVYWIAQRYGYSGNYKEEKNLYQQIIQDYSSSSYADKAKLDFAGAEVLTLVVAENDKDANEALEKLVADFNSHPYLFNAMIFMADKCHDEALRPEAKREDSNSPPRGNSLRDSSLRDKLYHFVIEMFEKYVFDRNSGKDNRVEAYYRAAVAAYRLGETEKTIDFADNLLQSEPNFRYAANMEWLIADGYEHMKAAGQIPADEADIIVEEEYQALMTNYPTHYLSDYAAIHLGEINMVQGKRTKACAYFGWFLMNADSNDCRIAYINEQCRRNSDE